MKGASRIGVAAFGWEVLYAAAHAYWAFGGSALLSPAMGAEGREHWRRDPWGDAVGWAALTLLFVLAGLFPLSLGWPGGRAGRRGAARLAVAGGYGGAALLLLAGVATGDGGVVAVAGVLGGGGGLAALARPRGVAVSRWLVSVATWALGGAMTIYGVSYLAVVAFGDVDPADRAAYLAGGGLGWGVGGVLFLATAWRARRVGEPGPGRAEARDAARPGLRAGPLHRGG